MNITDLQAQRREIEIHVLAAACVWRHTRGSVVEQATLNELASLIAEWERVSVEMDDLINQRLTELMA